VEHLPFLSKITRVSATDSSSGIKVLGTPLGDDLFIRGSLETVVTKMQDFCQRVISLDHTQACLALMRQCTGVCKILHLLKTLPEVYLYSLASEVDAVILDSCQRILGFICTETMKQQPSLHVRLGGLGVLRAQLLAPVASLVGGIAFWKFGSIRRAVPECMIPHSAVWFPEILLNSVCKVLPSTCAIPRLLLANKETPPELSVLHLQMKWWSTQVCLKVHQSVTTQSKGRDIIRLECQRQPHVGLWVQAQAWGWSLLLRNSVFYFDSGWERRLWTFLLLILRPFTHSVQSPVIAMVITLCAAGEWSFIVGIMLWSRLSHMLWSQRGCE